MSCAHPGLGTSGEGVLVGAAGGVCGDVVGLLGTGTPGY